MKTNQNKTINFNFSKYGFKCEITPLFFTTVQEQFGLDIKPMFVKLLRLKIERLQKAQELSPLTKQGKFDLENYKIAVQILTSD